MKLAVQIIIAGAYLWFLTNKIITPANSQLWKEEWVRVLLYSIVPILIWESVPRFMPRKKRKFNK